MYHVLSAPSKSGIKLTTEMTDLSPFTHVRYINTTGCTVYLKDRMGFTQVIPTQPGNNVSDGFFHVICSWAFMRYTNTHFQSSEIHLQNTFGDNASIRAVTNYHISLKEIECAETVLAADLGIILSTKRPLTVHDVFTGTSGKVSSRDTIISPEAIERSEELQINIIVVDNIKPNAPYYLNIEGHVYKIISITSEHNELPDGVHFYDGGKTVEGDGSSYYKLEDCVYGGDGKYKSPFVLFTNPFDAKTNGDRAQLLEAKSKEKDQELKLREQEILELKLLVQKMKEEAALRKEGIDKESDFRKDHYETRSYERKDRSESISMPAKVITGIVAFATACFGIAKLLL